MGHFTAKLLHHSFCFGIFCLSGTSCFEEGAPLMLLLFSLLSCANKGTIWTFASDVCVCMFFVCKVIVFSD